jgi:hypothetical protein
LKKFDTTNPYIKLSKFNTTNPHIKLKKFDTTTPHIKLKKFDTTTPPIKLKKFSTTTPHLKLKKPSTIVHSVQNFMQLKKLWTIVMLFLLLEDQLQRVFLLIHIVTIVPRSFPPRPLLPSLTLLHILVTTLCSHTHTLLGPPPPSGSSFSLPPCSLLKCCVFLPSHTSVAWTLPATGSPARARHSRYPLPGRNYSGADNEREEEEEREEER